MGMEDIRYRVRVEERLGGILLCSRGFTMPAKTGMKKVLRHCQSSLRGVPDSRISFYGRKTGVPNWWSTYRVRVEKRAGKNRLLGSVGTTFRTRDTTMEADCLRDFLRDCLI